MSPRCMVQRLLTIVCKIKLRPNCVRVGEWHFPSSAFLNQVRIVMPSEAPSGSDLGLPIFMFFDHNNWLVTILSGLIAPQCHCRRVSALESAWLAQEESPRELPSHLSVSPIRPSWIDRFSLATLVVVRMVKLLLHLLL